MSRVGHFEIHADDPNRAISFYQNTFAWEFTKWDGPQDYWLIKTGDAKEPGIDGGLMKRVGGSPAECQAVNAYVCTIMTNDLDVDLTKAIEQGASVALPRMAVPGVGWMAYVKDPEGNIIGIMECDDAAI